MYAAIVAILLVIAAAVAFGFAVVSAGANHIGGATAPDRVDHRPTYIGLLLGVVFVVLAIVVGVTA